MLCQIILALQMPGNFPVAMQLRPSKNYLNMPEAKSEADAYICGDVILQFLQVVQRSPP